jgi:hypothetical protein
MRTLFVMIVFALVSLNLQAAKPGVPIQDKKTDKAMAIPSNIAVIDTGFNVIIDGKSINLCKAQNARVSYFNCINKVIYIVLDSNAAEPGWIVRTFYSIDTRTKNKMQLAILQIPKPDNKKSDHLVDITSGKAVNIYPGGVLPAVTWPGLISCFMYENGATAFDYLYGNIVFVTAEKGMIVYDRASHKIRKIGIKDAANNKYASPYFSSDANRVAYVHSRNFSSTNPSTDIIFYDLSVQKYVKRIQTFDVLQTQLSTDNKKTLTVYCRHMNARSTATVKDYIWRIDIVDLDKVESDQTLEGISACWIK